MNIANGLTRVRATRLRRPSWQSLTACGVAALLVLNALTVEESKSAKLDLNEAGVWVTNADSAFRVNTEISQWDATAQLSGELADVLQDGRNVLKVDGDGKVRPLDSGSLKAGSLVETGPSPRVAMGGGIVAIADGKGNAWAVPFLGLADFKLGTSPIAKLGTHAQVEVGATGHAFGLSTERHLIEDLSGRGGTTDLKLDGANLEFAVVGDLPAVLSTADGRLQIGGHVIELAGKFGTDPHLQWSSAAADFVVVATDTSLVRVPIDGSPPSPVYRDGPSGPVRPVSLQGCAYGAWSGDQGREVVQCGDAHPNASTRLNLGSGAELRFRVNRDHVLLNDTVNGRAWSHVDANRFPEIPLRSKNQQDPNGDHSKDKTDNGDPKACSQGAAKTAPVATKDAFQARPEVATILDVLANDTDADCDVLVITGVLVSNGASAQIVGGGGAVQFTAPAGVYEVTYTISDGTRAATTTVTVTVPADAGGNRPPRPSTFKRVVQVNAGSSVSYNVLGEFSDPDGDALTLTNAALASGSGVVRFTPDGTVTFTDQGAGALPRNNTVNVTVSDGHQNGSATGHIDFEVVADAKPRARDDRAQGIVGQSITIPVLGNDTDPTGGGLQLVGVDEVKGGIVPRVDAVRGVIVVRVTSPGTATFRYTVAAGAASASAHVTVVATAPVQNRPPVAVRDVVLVPLGGSAVVDVVANDIDPDNDVLVVQSVEAVANTGITATVLEHRAVRISAQQPSPDPVRLTYQLSDGISKPVTGQIVVFVASEIAANRAPVAKDDVAVVRAGDVVSVPVVANDADPDGDQLSLDPNVQLNVTPGVAAPGTAFVEGGRVRFLAGQASGLVTMTYTISDPAGERASALVRITILPADERNQAPLPRDLEARVFAGGAVDVVVPIDGVDPDGDSITFALDSQPTKGRVVRTVDSVQCRCFHYEAYAGAAGTDSFTYLATDPRGASASATVRVGIAERPAINQSPVVTNDTVLVRPGRQATVAVLANDIDPEGDPLSFDPAMSMKSIRGVNPKVAGTSIVVTATGGTDTVSVPYAIVDGHGGGASGYLTVEVSPDAPLLPPIARDDVAELPNGSATSATVAVLRNDEDPDGSVNDLKVGVKAVGATVVGDQVRVTIGRAPSVMPYTITDRDGLSATAVIRVPGRATNRLPRFIAGKDAVDLKNTDPATINLRDYVEDPEGDAVTLTTADHLGATHGSVSAESSTAIKFTPDTGYVGPASVTFEVSDRSDPADPTAAKATLSLAINLTGNAVPVVRGTRIPVPADASPVTTNLDDLVTYAGPRSDLKFTVDRSPDAALHLEVKGSSLVVSADKSLASRRGQSFLVPIGVRAGSGAEVKGFVEVVIVSSTAPLPRAVTDIAEAQAGKPIVVKVLANDVGDPLTVVDVLTAPNIGTVSHDATSVTLTPDAGFHGSADLTYSITDNPADPERRVNGIVRLIVKDRPENPSAPTVAQYGNGFVVLNWVPGSSNGAPIDEYEVSATGVQQNCGVATSCRIVGLRNGSTYTFTVRAHNVVDWSNPSPASLPVTPDVLPGAPGAPALTYQPGPGGTLTVTWTPPVNDGSALKFYEVQLAGLPAQQVGATKTSLVVSGLSNYQEYTAQVRAQNGQGWGAWSVPSPPESPADLPAAPAAPVAVAPSSPIGQQIQVSWTAPAANAVGLTGYIIRQTKDGTTTDVPASVPVGDANLTQVLSSTNGSTYSFRIIAVNKAGQSPPSASSGPTISYGTPFAVGGVAASAPGINQTVDLTFADPGNNGNAITSYQVTVSGAGTRSGLTRTSPGGPVRVAGLTNGISYTFAVAACNAAGCGPASGGSGAATPYGPPSAPGLGGYASGATDVVLTWSAPPGNGAPISRVMTSIDGGGFADRGLSGNVTVPGGYSQVHTIQAYASSGSTLSATATFQVRSNAAPAAVNLVWGSAASVTGCSSGCRRMVFNVSGFPPGSSQSVRCEYNTGSGWRSDFGYTPPNLGIDGAGNGGWGDSPLDCVGSPPGGWTYRVVVGGVPSSAIG